MSTHRHLRRTDLFLLRLWTEEEIGGGPSEPVLRGRVQRIVDGESHQFDDWQSLVDVLLAMLNQGNDGKPTISSPGE